MAARAAEIDTDVLAQKTAAYAKAQQEATKAKKTAEEKEAVRLTAHAELLAAAGISEPRKRGPVAANAKKAAA